MGITIVDAIYHNREARIYNDYSPSLRAERKGLVVKMSVIAMLCGEHWEKQKEQNRRIWDADGTAPTLTAICGGGQHLKVCKRERERERERAWSRVKFIAA